MRKLLLVFFLLPFWLAAEEGKLSFIYYYGWYGNPDWNSDWIHWQEYEHLPPRDISSSYYPRLGPYSSTDPVVLDQHVRWMAGANINVIIYSWWGQKDFSNAGVPQLLDISADYGLKVAFLIEPYPDRTPQRICDDVDYLIDRYGSHPAFFRMSHRTAEKALASRRPLFFIYQPDIHSEAELRRLSEQIHNSSEAPLLLLQSTDVSYGLRTGVDGIFAYEAYQNVQHFYRGIVNTARKAGLLFIPCVSPGFNINRTMNEKSEIFRPRRLGRTFDEWWERVIAAGADHVAIISFNEWHEGTQIEPAARPPFPARSYLTYEGSYGKRKGAAEQSYLRRAARWIEIFQRSVEQ